MKEQIQSQLGRRPFLLNKVYNAKQDFKRFFIKRLSGIYNDLRKDTFPKNIQIQTVSSCNARCIMCPYKDVRDKISHGTMGGSLFKKIIDECKEHDVSGVYPFLMNEPLMDGKIFERIEYINESLPDAKVEIATNASLLNRERARKLAKCKVDVVNFDVQGGRKEIYERITQNLDFEETVENIKYFLSLEKRNDPLIKIPSLLGVLSREEVKGMVDFWKDEEVRVSITGTQDRAGNLKEENIDIENFDRGEKIYGCEHDRHLKWLHILHNGKVVLCCQDWEGDVVLGDLGQQCIEEIWNSEEYEETRDRLSSRERADKDFLCKNVSLR